MTEGKPWLYIEPAENPALIAAGGLDVNELLAEKRWWHGPADLAKSGIIIAKPGPTLSESDETAITQECKPITIAAVRSKDWWIADKYSSFTQMSTMVAIVKKWLKIWQQNVHLKSSGTFQGLPDDEGVFVTRRDAKESLPEQQTKGSTTCS